MSAAYEEVEGNHFEGILKPKVQALNHNWQAQNMT